MKKKEAKYPIPIREWSENDRPREKLLKYGEHTPCNVYPACPVAPGDGTGVESVTIPLGRAYFTGVFFPLLLPNPKSLPRETQSMFLWVAIRSPSSGLRPMHLAPCAMLLTHRCVFFLTIHLILG